MSLASGQTLSFYEILGPLGSGAMGEVYRARDTRLDREVAIKVLPEHFAEDEGRLRRFEREAKTLASLSHANLAHVYGIDEVDDTCFMAMELVPGEDLATRLARGRLAVDEAIDVCRQIAEGLEAAHEAGVVHRDLKPANVRITPEGVVKVLDFGLAKPLHPRSTKDGTTTAESDSFLMTEEGIVLGTPTYMSPEQARAKPVDKRTDIWAFGCVLFECLTGRRAFGGESLTDTLASIVGQEPDWSLVPPLPERVSELLRRTLTKDPRRRLRDMGEARVALELAGAEPIDTAREETAGARPRSTARVVSWTILLALAIAAGFAIARLTAEPGEASVTATAPTEPPAIHAILHEFPPSISPRDLEISHDGRSLAWLDDEGLWLRELAEPEPRLLHAGELEDICWSPDDTGLAFIENDSTWRIPVTGGRPEPVPGGELPDQRYMTWLPDGRFVFGSAERVWTLPAEGGDPTVLLLRDDEDVFAHWHAILPLEGGGILGALHRLAQEFNRLELFRDGKVEPVLELPGVELGKLDFSRDGLFVYAARIEGRSSVWSVPFSLDGLEVGGAPHLEVEDAMLPSVADDGSLAYLKTEHELDRRRMAWLNPGEPQLELLDEARDGLNTMALSGDRRKIAFTVFQSPRTTVWVMDLDRGLAAPAIRCDAWAGIPVWLDDDHVVLSSFVDPRGAVVYSLVGREQPEHLSEDVLFGASPDKDYFVFATIERSFQDAEFRIVGPGLDGPRLGFLDHADGDRFVAFAPNGEWMLYSSERSGTRQLYLTRFPPSDEQWLVSPGETGGAWFRDDLQAIYFVASDSPSSGSELYRVDVSLDPQVKLGAPELVRQLEPNVHVQDYDGSERFLVSTGDTPTRTQVFLDTGWARRSAGR